MSSSPALTPHPTAAAPTLRELENHEEFIARHIGISAEDEAAMLRVVGSKTRAELIDGIVPAAIRRSHPMRLPPPAAEAEALCGRIAMLKQGRVVALDRTSALLAGTASTMMRFKLDAPLPPVLASQARVTGRIVQVKAHDAAEVEQVLSMLRAAGCQPEDLEIGRADLEDVFLEIMQSAPMPLDETKVAT